MSNTYNISMTRQVVTDESAVWADVAWRTSVAEAVYNQARREIGYATCPWSSFDADACQRIVDAIKPLMPAPQPPHSIGAESVAAESAIAWPKTRDVGRIGDMSQSAHLRVGLDSDNDVYVSVWGDKGGGSVEFCNPGAGGGGQSSRTRTALIALMVAMEADNAERPARDWWAARARLGDGA